MKLSPNKRITLNVIVSWNRTLLGVLVGIFTGRWTLEILGIDDFGLYGLIGGLSVFISFFNNILCTSVVRFYSVAVGFANSDKPFGLNECRAWFNTALLIFTVGPICFFLIGYPIGTWCIYNWLTIPVERVNACTILFAFVSANCFLEMICVPYMSFYFAKQYLAELTVCSFFTLTARTLFLWILLGRNGDWLVAFGIYDFVINLILKIILCGRAILIFPECKYCWSEMYCVKRLKKMFKYSSFVCIGYLAYLAQNQALAFVANKFRGPSLNAAMSVANNLAGYTMTLSGGLISALQPAIANAYGEKKFQYMQKLSFTACKVSVFLILCFAIPLALELPEVLRIWLKNPPPYTQGLCLCILIATILDKVSVGHYLAVMATEKIGLFQTFGGFLLILTVPIACLCLYYDLPVYFIVISSIITTFSSSLMRVVLAQKLLNMSIYYWFKHVLIPLAAIVVVSSCAGILIIKTIHPGFLRIIFTSTVTLAIVVTLAYTILLDHDEKIWLTSKIKSKIKSLKCN